VQHFFELNPFPTEIAPGDTVIFEFMIAPARKGITSITFTYIETGEQASLTIELTNGPPTQPLPFHAAIQGQVTTSDGTPLVDQEVIVYLAINMAIDFRTRTDHQGRYYLEAPLIDDIRQMLGTRPLPYTQIGYTLIVAREGYKPEYREHVDPTSRATVNFSLEPVATRSYRLTGEHTFNAPHGYFWIVQGPGFEQLFAVQGRHPPELRVPGHIIAIDRQGNEQWRQPTGDECWGFDVSIYGTVAAGCHDSKVYLRNASGNIYATIATDQMDRAVRFSPDGQTLVTGPLANNDAALLDVRTGNMLWTYKLPGEMQ